MRLQLALAVTATLFTSGDGNPVRSQNSDKFVSRYREEVICKFDDQVEQVATVMHIGYDSDDKSRETIYMWRTRDGRTVIYKGSGETDRPGFWFGQLNGKEAAGYSLNRGHWVFGTADTSLQFGCWMEGYEHGSY